MKKMKAIDLILEPPLLDDPTSDLLLLMYLRYMLNHERVEATISGWMVPRLFETLRTVAQEGADPWLVGKQAARPTTCKVNCPVVYSVSIFACHLSMFHVFWVRKPLLLSLA